MRSTTAALALATAACVVGVPAAATASGQAHDRPGQTHCKNDGHSYIWGKSATAHGDKAKFTGKLLRFHPCGEDDGYFTNTHRTITLTLTPASTIKVFKNELNPSVRKTVTAAHFPRAFNHRKAEPYYRFHGPTTAVRKLSEFFRP